MSKKKATENELADLHKMLAIVLTAQVGEQVEDEEGELMYIASPAIIAAAIKFLKDNDISCDIDTNKDMNVLKDTLAAMPRLSDAAKAAEESDYEH